MVFLRLCRGFAPLGMLGEVSSLVTRGFAPLRGDEWCGVVICWWFCFAGGVPVGPFRLVGSEAIGEGVIETLKKSPKAPAVLMQNHGPQQADVQWP